MADGEQRIAELNQQLEALENANGEAEATVRAVQQDRDSMKRDWTEMFMSDSTLKSRITALEGDLIVSQQAHHAESARCDRLEEQLRVAQDVNQQVMTLKANTELQLLAALARGASDAVQSQCTVTAPPHHSSLATGV